MDEHPITNERKNPPQKEKTSEVLFENMENRTRTSFSFLEIQHDERNGKMLIEKL
jgi:hypothetical protein